MCDSCRLADYTCLLHVCTCVLHFCVLCSAIGICKSGHPKSKEIHTHSFEVFCDPLAVIDFRWVPETQIELFLGAKNASRRTTDRYGVSKNRITKVVTSWFNAHQVADKDSLQATCWLLLVL